MRKNEFCLNFYTGVRNTNFDDRSGVTDLFAVADIGLNARRMVRYNANTLNSPFKAGLTGTIDSGLAIITMGSSGNYGTILCIPEGGIYTSSCVCKKTMVCVPLVIYIISIAGW